MLGNEYILYSVQVEENWFLGTMYLEVFKKQYDFTQSNSGIMSETIGKNNSINNIMDLIELYVRDIKQNILY